MTTGADAEMMHLGTARGGRRRDPAVDPPGGHEPDAGARVRQRRGRRGVGRADEVLVSFLVVSKMTIKETSLIPV